MRSKRVLIVNPDTAAARTLEFVLAAYGHQVEIGSLDGDRELAGPERDIDVVYFVGLANPAVWVLAKKFHALRRPPIIVGLCSEDHVHTTTLAQDQLFDVVLPPPLVLSVILGPLEQAAQFPDASENPPGACAAGGGCPASR